MKKIIIFLLLLYPFYHIGYSFSELTNPISYIILTSGEWALGMLLLTVALTPLRNIFKHAEFSQYKRMFGLFTFFYATVHLLTYAGLDYRFNFVEIYNQILKNKFILVGFIAWLLLLPLAITSNNYSIRLLKKKWKLLHKLVYPITLFSILHYLWLSKTILWEPFIYAAIALIIVLLRFGFDFRSFWYKYSHLLFIVIIIAPVVLIARQGSQPQVVPEFLEDPNSPHIYNGEYFVCYEQSINAGETYEVRVNKCGKLWKKPSQIEWQEIKPKSTREQKDLNIIQQGNN